MTNTIPKMEAQEYLRLQESINIFYAVIRILIMWVYAKKRNNDEVLSLSFVYLLLFLQDHQIREGVASKLLDLIGFHVLVFVRHFRRQWLQVRVDCLEVGEATLGRQDGTWQPVDQALFIVPPFSGQQVVSVD